MILFKACPRCGGDVDASYHDDAHCVQCSYRPAIAYPGPRVVEVPRSTEGIVDTEIRDASSPANTVAMCPKCGSEEVIRLDRLRPEDHICYRCRSCGHIFSPQGRDIGQRPDAALS